MIKMLRQNIGKYGHKLIFILLTLGILILIINFPLTREELMLMVLYYFIMGWILVVFYYLDVYWNYFELN